MVDCCKNFPPVRGKYLSDEPLAPYTWFRVGGPADFLFLPADEDDLSAFLRALPEHIPVCTLGSASNTIVRDGGIDGVVVRLTGRHWGRVVTGENRIIAGGGALDVSVAKTAAKAGFSGLSFLAGIPGSMGGAVRTNAGCHGTSLSDVLLAIEGITRAGEPVFIRRKAICFGYRHTDFADNIIVTRLHLKAEPGGDSESLVAEIAAHQAQRRKTQPVREKTGGSTFVNPDTGLTPERQSAWALIDAAGCRNLRVGGARVSEKHCNFLINDGGASAADIEALGELVRARVEANSGVRLKWEIRRIGRMQVKMKSQSP